MLAFNLIPGITDHQLPVIRDRLASLLISGSDLCLEASAARKLSEPLCDRIPAVARLGQHLNVFTDRRINVAFSLVHRAQTIGVYGLIPGGVSQVFEYTNSLVKLKVIPIYGRDLE